MADSFAAGDKVFAKIRGHSPWPARIEAVISTISDKLRYHVLFYGTLQTGICKRQDLIKYNEQTRNYCSRSRRKMFDVALAQCRGLIPLPEHFERSRRTLYRSEIHGTFKFKENIIKNINSEKWKLNGSGKHFRRSIKQCTSSSQSSLSPGTPNTTPQYELVSRSGRKITPKRFADNERYSHTCHRKRTHVRRNSTNDAPRLIEETKIVDKGVNYSEYHIKNHKIHEGKLMVRFMKVKSSVVSEEKRHTKISFKKDESQVGKNSGEFTPRINYSLPRQSNNLLRYSCVKNGIKANAKISDTTRSNILYRRVLASEERKRLKKYENILKKIKVKRETRAAWLITEKLLMELERNIRITLIIEKTDPQKALDYVNELIHVNIEPLMLKKHPRIVETIDKVKRFHGGYVDGHSEEEKIKYEACCKELRKKAKKLIDKFSKMFNAPVGTRFREFFDNLVTKFLKTTRHLNIAQFYALMIEPVRARRSKASPTSGSSDPEKQAAEQVADKTLVE